MREYFIWLAKFITVMLILFVFMPLIFLAMIGAAAQLSQETIVEGKKQVAVVELTGEIVSSKEILAELYKQAENKNITGIVLSINSPGGAVGPSQEIYSAVRKLREKKPIVAAMGALAASGGFYSALGASKVLCQPGTLTGSIGVIMQIPNFKKVSDWIGVDMVTIKSGALKDVGNSFREMTQAERDFLQSTVSKVQEDFVQAVVDGRGIEKSKVLEFADGRIILGSQAKEWKLVDGYGDVYDAARLVFELAGQPLKEGEIPALFYPSDKFGALKKVLDSVSSIPETLTRSVRLEYRMY